MFLTLETLEKSQRKLSRYTSAPNLKTSDGSSNVTAEIAWHSTEQTLQVALLTGKELDRQTLRAAEQFSYMKIPPKDQIHPIRLLRYAMGISITKTNGRKACRVKVGF